ncbi:MAG: hypothetical protein AB7T49_14650 [Oligoflexales bacterium]
MQKNRRPFIIRSSGHLESDKVVYLTKTFRQGARLRALLKEHHVEMPQTIQQMFLLRPYDQIKLANAVVKYKIFGDLGLADE